MLQPFIRDGKLLPGVAQTAMQGARHAAKNILRRLRGEPTTPFVYRDLGSMAIVGRRAAISDLGWIRLSGALAWLSWLFLHIFMLIGLQEPDGRAVRMGDGLLHVPARGPAHHRGREDNPVGLSSNNVRTWN